MATRTGAAVWEGTLKQGNGTDETRERRIRRSLLIFIAL